MDIRDIEIQDIDNELDRLSKMRNEIYDREYDLGKIKERIISDIFLDKNVLQEYEWEVEIFGENYQFLLYPIMTNSNNKNSLVAVLDDPYHGSLNLTHTVRLRSYDGLLQIVADSNEDLLFFVRKHQLKIIFTDLVWSIEKLTEKKEAIETDIAQLRKIIESF